MPVPAALSRVATALVAVALALPAIKGGIDTIRFDIVRKAAVESGRGDALAPWASSTGFASPSLEAMLRLPGDGVTMDALGLRRELLTQWLAARPLASQGWIMLAAVRHALATPPALVDEAFMMSALTGPAETDAMAQRVLLGLLAWETSPAGMQQRTASDLCGLVVDDPSRLRLVLTTKPDAVRAAIRRALVDRACTPRIIAAVGL